MFGRAMPLKSGSSRNCSSEAACRVAIGWFRNANNRHTCGPSSALIVWTSRYQRASGARKSFPSTLSSRLYLFTDAFFYNGRTTTGPSSINSLQTFAHAPPLPPFALLRFVRRASVPEIQNVEERAKVRPGCRNRLLFQRENILFCVLRTDDCGADF